MKMLIPLTLALFGIVLSGCSSGPPDRVVDEAVDWHLRQTIDGGGGRSVYKSYKIINNYTERSGDNRVFVYDYEAECSVTSITYFNWSDTSTRGGWTVRPSATSKPELRVFSGSVSLVKKGSQWYASSTIR